MTYHNLQRFSLLVLLPAVASHSFTGNYISIAYMCTVGFFTGLLAVATSAQIFVSHLVSRYMDSAAPIKTFSKVNRMVWFFGQTFLTLFVGIVVLAAPYGNARWVIFGERDVEGDKWSQTWRLATALIWTAANGTVLLDTMLFSIISVKKLAQNHEKGGALLVLMASAGASDFVNFSKIRDSLMVSSEIDELEVWHQGPSKENQLVLPSSCSPNLLVSRLIEEQEAVDKSGEAEQRICSSLLQIGAPALPNLRVAILRANFRTACKNRIGPTLKISQTSNVFSELSLSQHITYRSLLNSGREAYWRFTKEKMKMGGSRLCEPRIAALDLLHTHRRMVKWPHDHITVRNSVLHWARSRAIAEWISVVGINPECSIELKDSRIARQVNANWWKGAQQIWKSFSSVKQIRHMQLNGVDDERFDHEIDGWRKLSKFGFGEKGYQESWLEDRENGLDNLGHGKDWAEMHMIIDGSRKVDAMCWTLESGDVNLSLGDALDLRGSGENISGMTASGWYALMIMDMVMMFEELTQKDALNDRNFAIFAIGMSVLGMIRVSTRRAGRHEVMVIGMLWDSDLNCGMRADFIYSLGWECAQAGLHSKMKKWWNDEKPACVRRRTSQEQEEYFRTVYSSEDDV